MSAVLPDLQSEGRNPLTIDQQDAAKRTSLSAKTLGRLADAGEPVGRLKVGRRVLYHVPTLAAWLAARAGSQSQSALAHPEFDRVQS